MVKETTVDKVYNRLSQIKSILDSNGNETISTIARTVKGNTHLYTILGENKIVIKTEDGLIWNTKIPVSRILAQSIHTQIQSKDIECRDRYKKKQSLVTNNKGIKKSKNSIV